MSIFVDIGRCPDILDWAVVTIKILSGIYCRFKTKKAFIKSIFFILRKQQKNN